MDNVSGLPDKSNNFSNFLTVCWRFDSISLYIFHITYFTIATEKQTIIFQLEISGKTNQLYFSLSNKLKYSCLTIECRNAGPAKYRTDADSNFEQFCYFDQYIKDRLFNKFLAERVLEYSDSLVFEIDSMINTAKNSETKIYKAIQRLQSLVKTNNGKDWSSGRKQ